MNGKLAESETLVRQLVELLPESDTEVCLCPPYTLTYLAGQWLQGSHIKLGAQNAHYAEKGAYTGEVSLPMLEELGCSYVILGHSERRMQASEDDEAIARKLKAAQAVGITPILCVGETLEQRDSGQGEQFVLAQVRSALREAKDSPLVVAYEPIWAIGTGRAASSEQATEMLTAIRRELGPVGSTTRLLYGGSVTSANIAEYMKTSAIDGALVGGASLKAVEFASLVTCVNGAFECTSK